MNEAEMNRLALVLEREAMTPMRYPDAVMPRWHQVAIRVCATVPEADEAVVMVACEAYLGEEA